MNTLVASLVRTCAAKKAPNLKVIEGTAIRRKRRRNRLASLAKAHKHWESSYGLMDQLNLRVPSVTDGHFLRVVSEQAAPRVVHKIRFTLFTSQSTTRDAPPSEIDNQVSLLGKVVALEGMLCRDISIDFEGGGTVILRRDPDPNTVAVSSFPDEVLAMQIHAKLGRALAAFKPNAPHAAVLGEDLQKYYAARDATLSRLEDSLSQLLKNAQDDLMRREEFFRDKEIALQAKLDAGTKEIADRRAVDQQMLASKEADLAERVKAVDDRAAKYARREIQERLRAEIKKRQSVSQLTFGTRRMRWPVIVALGVLAALLGYGFKIYTSELFVELAKPTPPDSFVLISLLVRQIFLGIGLGGTVWYFIHWQNQWFHRHADEEFRIKRLELDLDRASWVVELAMEWAKENAGKELPAPLMADLTKSLFSELEVGKKHEHEDVGAIAALLGAATSAEISVAGNKFTLNRKAAQKLQAALTQD